MKNRESDSEILAQERTLLAAERTFSAWLRTAIAAMASGLTMLRLIVFKTDVHRVIAHVIGETLIVWGLLIIIFASIGYRRVRNTVATTKSSYWSQLEYALIVVPLLLVSLLLIVVTLP